MLRQNFFRLRSPETYLKVAWPGNLKLATNYEVNLSYVIVEDQVSLATSLQRVNHVIMLYCDMNIVIG